MRRFQQMILATGVLALLAAVPAMAQETLKIGVLTTLSGAGAVWGQAMLHAAELAADDVNSAGGLQVADKRYKVVLIPYDDKYLPNEAVTAANRLVFEDHVKYMVGPMPSASVVAVLPLTEKNKVLTINQGFTPKALGPEKPFTFRPVLTTVEFSQPQIDWIVKMKGVKKVGGLFPNDETGQQIAHDVDVAYTKAGARLTSKEFFERERVDFVPLLTRILASGVDAIELDGNAPTTAGLIVKQAREVGYTGLIVRTGGPATQEIVAVAGKEAAEGVYVHTPIDPMLPSLAKHIERYTKKYNEPMNGFSPFWYDGVHMLFEAMQKAGTVTDTDKVRVAYEQIPSYTGVLGRLTWTGKEVYGINHQISAPFYVGQIKGGVEVIMARCTVVSCN